jgi:DNA-binding transcriptional LysR family regulator
LAKAGWQNSGPWEQDNCMGSTNEFLKVLPEMVTFVRVAELGSFSAAATDLEMTPSAVSRHVSRLERNLKIQLIQRTTRHLRLTEAGLEAFARCTDLVSAAQATMQVAQLHSLSPQGCLRLSAPKAFARRVMQPLILDFLAAHAEVDVRLLVTDRDVDPIKDGIDLVVRLTRTPPEGLAARALCAVESILCATPQYLAQHGPIEHPRDLATRSCLFLGENPSDYRWRFRRDDDSVDVAVNGRYAVNHTEMRLGGVLAHFGVGSVPDFVARPAMQQGAIVRVLPDWQLQSAYSGHAYVLYPPNRFLPPKCRVLIDYLVDNIGNAGERIAHESPVLLGAAA